MFISFRPMLFLTQRFCFPRVEDIELDSVEMVSGVQHRTVDVSQDAIKPNNVSVPPGATEWNEIESPLASLDAEPQGNAVKAQKTSFDTKILHMHADTCPNFTTPGIEESGFPRLESVSHSEGLGKDNTDVVDEVRTPNIVIFGEAGVGKSSVINLIAGQRRAHISNDALGCTFQYQRHNITLDGIPFAFWDTTGLDEGSEGTVPAKVAENNLKALIQSLAYSGGVHLVIYCTRGTRLTKALKHNYDLFYAAVCRKRVPIALVVTGLEHQQGDMETWWSDNKEALRRCGMRFDAHACVTTLEIEDTVIRTRRSESQRRLRNLVVGYAGQCPWKIEASLISWAMFHRILGGSSSRKTTRRVIIHDRTAPCQPSTRLIGDQRLDYELVYVDSPLRSSTPGKPAGLLIFYTSTPLDTRISCDDAAAVKIFYDIQVAGQETRPDMIVVIRGCNDDQVAHSHWDAIASRYTDIQAFPSVDEQAKLDMMIERLCIEHVEVKSSRLHRLYEAFVEFFAAVVHWYNPLL